MHLTNESKKKRKKNLTEISGRALIGAWVLEGRNTICVFIGFGCH